MFSVLCKSALSHQKIKKIIKNDEIRSFIDIYNSEEINYWK